MSRAAAAIAKTMCSCSPSSGYDAKGLLNPGKMATFVRRCGYKGWRAMKTWIPDARNFAYLTWKQVDALIEGRDAAGACRPPPSSSTAIICRLRLTRCINNYMLGKALALLPDEMPVYALPPVCYGKSNEHIGFPGTLSVSAATFMAVIRDLGASLAASDSRSLCSLTPMAAMRRWST